MSYFVQEIPKDIAAAPAEKIKVPLKAKIFAAICAILTYILIVLFAKNIYSKHYRLDKADDLVLKTEEMMHNLHSIDRHLAVKLERIENMVYDEDYDVTTEY